MVFGVIVGNVVGAFIPIEAELALRFSASEPVEAETEHLDSLRNDSVVRESDRSRVISLDRRRRLRPSHFDEGIAQGYHFTRSDEESRKLGFSGRGHHKFDDLGDGQEKGR